MPYNLKTHYAPSGETTRLGLCRLRCPAGRVARVLKPTIPTRNEGHAARQDQAHIIQHHQALQQRGVAPPDPEGHRLGRGGCRGGAAAFHRTGHRIGRRPRTGPLHRHRRGFPDRVLGRKPRADLRPHRRLCHHRCGHRGHRRHGGPGGGHYHRRCDARAHGLAQARHAHTLRSLHHYHRLHRRHCGDHRDRPDQGPAGADVPRRHRYHRHHGQAGRSGG